MSSHDYDRDYHKFEDCPWPGVNDPMCWLCFRYTMGFKDGITEMNTCLANGVPPNDSPLFQSVLQRHGAWALKLELAKWEGGGYPRPRGPYPRLPGRGLWGNVRVSMPCRGAARVTTPKYRTDSQACSCPGTGTGGVAATVTTRVNR